MEGEEAMQGVLTRPGTWKKGSEKGSSSCVKKGSSWDPASSSPLGTLSESSSELPAWCLPMRLAACLFSLHKCAKHCLGLPYNWTLRYHCLTHLAVPHLHLSRRSWVALLQSQA